MKNNTHFLCFRCEFRATYLEEGYGPRSECKSKSSVYSCYMYRPVKPLILEKNTADDRPQFAGSMISARSHAIGIVEDFELDIHNDNTIYWKPKIPQIKWEKIKYDYWLGICGRLLFLLNAVFKIKNEEYILDYWELEIQYQNNQEIDDHRFDTVEKAKEFADEWIKLLFVEDEA